MHLYGVQGDDIYKSKPTHASVSIYFYVKLQEEGHIKTGINGSTLLWPMFVSDSILVRREELAYPFSSFLAECGGVLGLFIGFNFMMVWGWGLDFLAFCLKITTNTWMEK